MFEFQTDVGNASGIARSRADSGQWGVEGACGIYLFGEPWHDALIGCFMETGQASNSTMAVS